MGQMCMTDADMTQDNFILPALPVGGLPISQVFFLCPSVVFFIKKIDG